MASILGLLEVRESAARERVEDLREAAARAAAALEAAEIELDRRVIAREELVEALAASATGTTALTEAETEAESVPASAPLPGTTVPSWREGLSATALSPDYQRILGMLADRPGREPVKAKEIAVMLGLEPTAGEGGGRAVEGEATGGARMAGPGSVGDVQRRPRARGRARRRLIRVIIDHWIMASLVAVRVS